MPKRGPPGWDIVPSFPQGMSKKTAVLAFFMAISIEPNQAPSIRLKATKNRILCLKFSLNYLTFSHISHMRETDKNWLQPKAEEFANKRQFFRL